MAFTRESLSISTMWNYRKAKNGTELIEQLLALGFRSVELNYQVREEWIREIEEMISKGRVRISSVHNVFPKVSDERFSTDSVLLGYEDETLRERAVALSKRSIDYAVRFGAGAVVFHPTEVPLDREKYDARLKQLIREHKADTDEFLSLRRKMLSERRSEKYITRMLKSVEALSEYVLKTRAPVKLGMENRAMCHQIPIYTEFEVIAEAFDGGPAGIWLDTGHGIMMEEMGLQALPLSESVKRNIVGMHIHDAADGLDHYAPCTLEGNVLDAFSDIVDECPIRVLELSGRLSREEILLGTERFLRRYGEKNNNGTA